MSLPCINSTDHGNATPADLLSAARTLAALTRAEYPDDCSLAEIAAVWGNAPPDAVAALERVQQAL
jgi:hypothetical protein